MLVVEKTLPICNNTFFTSVNKAFSKTYFKWFSHKTLKYIEYQYMLTLVVNNIALIITRIYSFINIKYTLKLVYLFITGNGDAFREGSSFCFVFT